MIDFFQAVGGFIMAPLYYVISAVLLGFHNVFGDIFGPASGIAWVLSIIGLTLVVRIALIPLFVKQIKSSRNMQLIQPKVRELQKKYGHDRERFAQEQMKLFKDSGTNPLASCMPLLLQMPIFIALFRLIDRAANGEVRGVLTQGQVDSLAEAKIFGARIADTFTDSLARLTGEEQKAVKTTAFDLQLDPAQPGMSFHKLDRARPRGASRLSRSVGTGRGRSASAGAGACTRRAGWSSSPGRGSSSPGRDAPGRGRTSSAAPSRAAGSAACCGWT